MAYRMTTLLFAMSQEEAKTLLKKSERTLEDLDKHWPSFNVVFLKTPTK